jgi:hypothetical protein
MVLLALSPSHQWNTSAASAVVVMTSACTVSKMFVAVGTHESLR